MSIFSTTPQNQRQSTPSERVGYAVGDTLSIALFTAGEIGRRVAHGAGAAIETIQTVMQEGNAAAEAEKARRLQLMQAFAALPVEAQDEYFDQQAGEAAQERSARMRHILGAPGRGLRGLFYLTSDRTPLEDAPLATVQPIAQNMSSTGPFDPVA
ncbi:hypothetical protein E6P97_01415 [Patescibacteria group bacterium]|nr:MAG: hypothetical protein E6P97_01415 [Patescibacteria group bacterium]